MDPPGTVQFMDVHPNDSRYGTVLQIIQNSFLDPHYQPSWVIHSLQTVKNLKLFQHYKTKSEELKLSGRDVTEYDMFTCYKTVDLIKNILEHGLQTRHSSFNFLGNSQKGVNLCRHADIQLKAADNTGQEECYLIIYKVMLGKALPVYPSPDNEQLAPTENFDSHISSLGVDRTIPLGQQAIRSQVFCYEYINGQLSSCPRHVLPYVVVCYKRPSHATTGPPSISIPLQIQRPTIQPPPPPLVQMAPAPQPPAIPGMYQPHSNNDISKMPAFQPRLPPRNPFRTQQFPLPACPPPPFQANHRTQYTRGQGIPTATACQAMPNLNLSSSGLIVPLSHQPTTGMRLPYISPPPPLLDNGNHLMFSHPGKSHFHARAPITSHPQLPNQQNFSMFHSSARPVALHSGMSIPLQLPVSETREGNIQPASGQKKEITGMRLPIIIQPEEHTPDETTHMSEESCNERQDLHMCLPTVTSNGPSPPSQLISSATNHMRPISPIDVKPDISKIPLKISRRKPASPENIVIDDEVLPGPEAPDKNGESVKITSTQAEPQQYSLANTVLTPSNTCQHAIQTADVVSGKQVSVLSSKSDKLAANDHRNDLQEVHSVSCSQQTKPAGNVSLVHNLEREINAKYNIQEGAHGQDPSSNGAQEIILNEEELNDQNHGPCKITKKLHLLQKSFPQSAQADDETLPDLDEDDSENTDFHSCNRVRDRNVITAQSNTARNLSSKRKYQDIIRNLKNRRKENPFIRKRANLFKLSDKRILNTLVQYPVTEEKSVYEFCHNGSIKMFCDASYDSKHEHDKLNINKPQGKRLFFDKRLCQMEIDFLLKDIGAESVIFENEGFENTLHIGHSNAGSPCKSVCPSGSACKEVQQASLPVNQDVAVLDIETVRSDNQSDDQTEASEVKDDWGTVIRDQRFQPKVIVKDIRSCSDWETFVSQEKATDTLSEESESSTVQMSRAESVECSISREPDVSNGSRPPKSSSGALPENSKGLIVTAQTPVPACETSVSSEQQTENLKTPNLNQVQDENPVCKTSAQTGTELESRSNVSVETGYGVRTSGSASLTKANCKNSVEQLKHVERSKPPSTFSSSLEIDGSRSEGLVTEPVLMKDLNKDDTTKKVSGELSKPVEVVAGARGKCSAGTATNSREPTPGLQSGECKETRGDGQKGNKKVNTGYDRTRSEQGRLHAHLHRSYSHKYRHLPYRYRRSRHAKQFGSFYNRDKKGRYSYHRERKRRHSSDRYRVIHDKWHGVSLIHTDPDKDISSSKELKETEGYRSGSDEKPSASEPKGRRHYVRGYSSSREAKKQRTNKYVSQSELAHKEEVAKPANEAQVLREEEKEESNSTDTQSTRSEPDEQTEQSESLSRSVQPESSAEDDTRVDVAEKHAESKFTSSVGLLKTCTEPDQQTTEGEAKNVNEKWVETCERLFLGRSGKEGSPLFDGYSASSECSAAADPSQWLTKLIRINTKRTALATSQEQLEKSDATSSQEADVRNTNPSTTDTPAPKTELDTPATSAENTGASSPARDAGPGTGKKSEVNMSREELSNLVSRALTILNPAGSVAATADSHHGEAQVEQTGASSWQNRVSVKYIHRKRKSLPPVGTQDSCEASLPPKLWGTQSLEKMHQSVTCEEPPLSSLPKYPLSAPQTPLLISSSSESESVCSRRTETDLTSTNSQGSACRAVTGSLSVSGDIPAQSKDPRLRRLSLSPRAESGSDVENVFHSPLSVDSPIRDSSVVSSVDVENKLIRPKNKISKLWEASISAPKALGNESVAFRELKVKERRTEPGHVRRLSSSDRPERKLSADDRFANYSPWKRELHLIDISECRCYQYLEQQPESKDPRFSRKWTVHDGELGKRATKHCRNIPLERIRKEKTVEMVRHSSSGDGKCPREEEKRKASTKTDVGDDHHKIALAAQISSDCDPSLEIKSQPVLSCRTSADYSDVKKCTSRNPKLPTETRTRITDIGACCPKVRAIMEEVWRLGGEEYQSLNNDMTHLLNRRIQRIEDSQRFTDPSKGLDQHGRLKLIASTDVSDDIIKELQIEEKMRAIKEKNHHMRQKLDDALRTKSLSDNAIKDLKFQIDIRDIRYEKYNKELEDLGRFYKSSVVEVLPDIFRLDSEKNKFISAEGNMLFLMSPLKEADCTRLLALREEIREYQKMVDEPGAADEGEPRARLCLGWLHGERKEMLCQLCLNMYRTKQALLQRFLDKRTWCSKAESVLQLRHEKDDLRKYIRSRSQRLESYISVLKNVQRLDNGVWTVKTSKCGGPEAQTIKGCNENITESHSTNSCELHDVDGTSDSNRQIDSEKKGRVKGSDEDKSKTSVETENKVLQEDNLKRLNNTDLALKGHDEQAARLGSAVVNEKGVNNTATQRENTENTDNQLQSESKLDNSFASIHECGDMEWHQLGENNPVLASEQVTVDAVTNAVVSTAVQYLETGIDKPVASSLMVSQHHISSSFPNGHESLEDQSRTSTGCSSEAYMNKLDEGQKQGLMDNTPVEHEDDNGCDAFASYGKYEQLCSSSCVQPIASEGTDKLTQIKKYTRKRRQRHKRQKGRAIGVVGSKSFLGAANVVRKSKRFRKSAVHPESAAVTTQYSSNHFDNGAAAFELGMEAEPGGLRLSDASQYAYVDSTTPAMIDRCQRGQLPSEGSFDHNYHNDRSGSRSRRRLRPWFARKRRAHPTGRNPDAGSYPYQQRPFHSSSNQRFGDRGRPASYYGTSNVPSRFQ